MSKQNSIFLFLCVCVCENHSGTVFFVCLFLSGTRKEKKNHMNAWAKIVDRTREKKREDEGGIYDIYTLKRLFVFSFKWAKTFFFLLTTDYKGKKIRGNEEQKLG
jgi:hypothetical protein